MPKTDRIVAGSIETILARESCAKSGRLVSTTLGKTRAPTPVRDFSKKEIEYMKVWSLKL